MVAASRVVSRNDLHEVQVRSQERQQYRKISRPQGPVDRDPLAIFVVVVDGGGRDTVDKCFYVPFCLRLSERECKC